MFQSDTDFHQNLFEVLSLLEHNKIRERKLLGPICNLNNSYVWHILYKLYFQTKEIHAMPHSSLCND